MTDFFSSLIQQTGIDLAPETGVKQGRLSDPAQVADEGPDAGVALETGDQQWTEPDPGQPFDPPSDENRADKESSTGSFPVQGRGGAIPEGEALTRDEHLGKVADPADQKQPSAGIEKPVPEPVEQYSPSLPRFEPWQTQPPDDQGRLHEAVLVRTADDQQQELPLEAAASEIRTMQGWAPAYRQERPPGKDIPQARIAHAVIREIHKWVAAQPVFTSAGERSRVAMDMAARVQHDLPRALDSTLKEKGCHKQALKKKPGEAKGVHYDLHLAIGPLNISLQRPEDARARIQYPLEKDARPAQEEISSRLRRHYLTR
jgi:hypothetical protein